MKPIKKNILLFFLTALCGTVCAQTYDTIGGKDGKLPHYFYPNGWFDTCLCYHEGNLKIGYEPSGNAVGPNIPPSTPPRWMAIEYRVDGPVAFVGVTVMVEDLYGYGLGDSIYCGNDTVYPDTISVICRDSSGVLNVIASVSTQWDTAPRRVLKIPLSADSLVHGFAYTFLYDLKFDHPVVVDSVYYLFGTEWNITWWMDGPYAYWFSHPYSHVIISPYNCPSNPVNPWGLPLVCDSSQLRFGAHMDGDKFAMNSTPEWSRGLFDIWGPYLLMIDSATIEVESADLSMGTAGPTRSMSKWVTQTITATPEYGYRFSHWDDGNTDNPRDVYLTQDTHFVAFFEPQPRHTLQTRCVPEGKGIVSGDGLYWYGDTVTMAATPLHPYVFHHWDDGNEDNPRQFTIEQDTAFTAFFSREELSVDTVADAGAIFTLTPNPTKGSVRCIIGEGTFVGGVLTMTDAAGREVLRQEVPARQADVEIDLSHLPAGTYFVTLATAEGSSTKKLVIK